MVAEMHLPTASSYRWWISTTILLLPFGLLLKFLKVVQMKLFAITFDKISVPYHNVMDQIKPKLFESMQELQSHDGHLRNQGLIRVLEIGVGPGTNFKHYPQNVSLILVDPNPYFMEKYLKDMPKLLQDKIERVINCEGENLNGIEANSVDAVVTTATLCSVRDVQAVLREIHRVLAKGGKYFFLEHVAARKGTKHHIMQTCFGPLMRLLYAGCHVDRDIGTSIQNANLFSKIEMDNMVLTWPFVTHHVRGPHLIGTAQK